MTAPRELAGQVAVVTGGSGSIGQAIVQALQQAGAHAVSLDLAAPPDAGAPGVVCDVRDDAAVAAALDAVYQAHHRLDVAIHAAGISHDAVVWKLPVDDWDHVLEVNLRGAFLLLRHAIPLMRCGTAGRIVLVGSINGSRGKFGASAYSASKAGLLGLAKSVARETGRFGICVNVIEPGWVQTPLTAALPEAVQEAARGECLLPAGLVPADVAAAVLFLCGSGGSRVTGQVLRVDAGQFLGGA